MTIDAKSFGALRDAVERDLLPVVRHAVAAGRAPVVVGIRRSKNGVTVRLALGQGVHVERDVVLDGRVFDLRVRLEVVGAAITNIVADAQRLPVAVGPVPLTRGSRP